MNVFIVYCHPCEDSFTYMVKESFINGLKQAGHSYVISDLYKMHFNPVYSEKQYRRDAYYNEEINIDDDVKAEQKKINNADIIVFIYPVFWTEAPSVLTGWFQRVWSYGFAYGNSLSMKILDKALFLVTMGGSTKDEIRQKQIDAMKTVMIGDRINKRAKQSEMIIFDEMTRGYGNDSNREERIKKFTKQAYEKGLKL